MTFLRAWSRLPQRSNSVPQSWWWRRYRSICAASASIIEETKRILGKRFGWPPEDIQDAEAEMRRLGRHIPPRVTLDVVKDDPADNRVLECAVSAESDFIVTGDKDRLRLRLYDVIRIVNVTDFLSIEAQHQRW